MPVGTLIKRVLFLAILTFCLSGAIGNSVAGPSSELTADSLEAVRTGAELERTKHWLDALDHYEQALKRWPESKDLQYGRRRSKIHYTIKRRYNDRSFESSLLKNSRRESLVLFDEVFQAVKANYVESVSLTSYVAHGTESFYLALANEEFRAKNLPNAPPGRIKQVRRILREQFWNKPVAHLGDATQTIIQVCEIAKNLLGIRPTAVVLEYVFGGCNALDDYSSFLTADRLEDLYGNIEGEFVGLGIEMKAEQGRGLLLVNVLPDSPASEGGLKPGEHITKIDGTDCREMNADEAARLLRGSAGSRVFLEVEDKDEQLRDGQFVRRSVQVKSIPVAKMLSERDGIGYIRMTGFQKTSVAELDAALSKLNRKGMRALIWDLRGNPGGLLTAAVEVSDRFIADGVLVSTRGRTGDQNWSYSAHRLGTWELPIVLLVDGDSASASEIVAGAIRDHRRGVIVGRKTYGKWSVQSIFPVHGSTGLRLTTAKFYSPRGKTFGKIGIRPHVVVEKPEKHTTLYRGSDEITGDSDSDIRKGLEVLRRDLSQR